ncbi:MAG: nucleoside hydrolase [Actinomycetota bacterium]|nr:nucleoside hydrolase [Actinomycetota bacterium]
MARNLILDCDTGVDDAVAIMLAALHPRLRLLGVTTVWGNAEVAVTTDNTLRVLDHIGRADVPVFSGLDRPLLPRDDTPPGRPHHVGSPYLPLPAAAGTAFEQPAVEWLVETLRAATEQVTLVATAPLTNVATAVRLEPRLVEAVAEVVVMGGSHAVGNVTASAERNVWSDPAAAAVVLSAGFERLVLVPLDATHDAALTEVHCRILGDLGTPAGAAASMFVADRIRAYGHDPALHQQHAAPVHDALTVAYLVAPEVLTLRHVHVAVETTDRPTYGRTVMDLDHSTGSPPNAHVALSADPALFFEVLRSAFAVGGASGGA